MAKRKQKMMTVNRWEDVPDNMTEAEEHEFWTTHSLGEGLLEQMQPVKDADFPPTRTPTSSKRISIVFETDTLKRLKQIAREREMGYQTLLKTYVTERLYEEEKQRYHH